MAEAGRTEQLQIRVTRAQKAAIARAARHAGVGMSAYVLGCVLVDPPARWRELLGEVARGGEARTALAAVNAWLAGLAASDLPASVAEPPPDRLSAFHRNYLAAMVEHVSAARGARPPSWCRDIAPLERPAFGSELLSLRLHLLAHSPPAFRRRNIFIDSTVGAQV